ncbi:hypothetical protein BpHYR1_012087 [Brachionus plicatilis]|uniref:Uncharacterized protein n=1 Tax=Brachionus plicatilis TaxID=10195 RepID=A0A3M7SSH6_BRAPC|nr:hypothetical protein BpHYR1_012087 [Brachionus plicatilis]
MAIASAEQTKHAVAARYILEATQNQTYLLCFVFSNLLQKFLDNKKIKFSQFLFDSSKYSIKKRFFLKLIISISFYSIAYKAENFIK